MEAIISAGGFQYKVKEQGKVRIPKLKGKEGDSVKFPLLMLMKEGETVIGEPYVEGASCEAKILGFGRTPKKIVYKYKSKKRYRRKNTHRQDYTEVLINKISTGKAE